MPDAAQCLMQVGVRTGGVTQNTGDTMGSNSALQPDRPRASLLSTLWVHCSTVLPGHITHCIVFRESQLPPAPAYYSGIRTGLLSVA